MAVKQQSNAFRNIGGIKYKNYADLAQDDTTNAAIVEEARKLYHKVRIIPNRSFGFKQVFVALKRKVCIDCGTDEMAAGYFGTAFMVHLHIWNSITQPAERPYMLCWSCVEKRLERMLQPGDFTDCFLNEVNTRLQSLKAEIKSIPLEVEDGQIVNGHMRARVAAELGLPITVKTLPDGKTHTVTAHQLLHLLNK